MVGNVTSDFWNNQDGMSVDAFVKLAEHFGQEGRPDIAERLLVSTVRIAERSQGTQSPLAGYAASQLAAFYATQGRTDEEEKWIQYLRDCLITAYLGSSELRIAARKSFRGLKTQR
jgi:hypothetical protein